MSRRQRHANDEQRLDEMSAVKHLCKWGSVSGNAYLPQTPEQFAYDADGNLTNDGRWSYVWDAENRLIQMSVNTSVGPQYQMNFAYDYRDRHYSSFSGCGLPRSSRPHTKSDKLRKSLYSNSAISYAKSLSLGIKPSFCPISESISCKKMSNQAKARVYVDFNSRDGHNDVILNPTAKEKQELSGVLKDGAYLILYDETVEIEAQAKWNEELKMWVAEPNLKTIRHLDYQPGK